MYNTTEKVGYAELCTSLYIVIRRSFFFFELHFPILHNENLSRRRNDVR